VKAMPSSAGDQRTAQGEIVVPLAPRARAHVLKHEDCFAALDAFGDAQGMGAGAEGLFLADARHLSRLALLVAGARPQLLSSAVRDDNSALVVDMAGPASVEGGRRRGAFDAVHIRKVIRLGEDAIIVRLELSDFGVVAASLPIEFRFDADFADIFQLRGAVPRQPGRRLDDEVATDRAVLAYLGRDGVTRLTRLDFRPRPDRISGQCAAWRVGLPIKGMIAIEITARCERSDRPARGASPHAAPAIAGGRAEQRRDRATSIATDSEPFNALLRRSLADLDMLVTETPQGPYPYAGLPWFATPFGRDGLITALQCLWLDPAIAAGTLRFLAFHQATSVDERADAEPGKILHELRNGEMASLGEVPFSRYYGSIDATPLFVVLAAAYHARTGDIALVREIWPNLEAALGWMENYGDADRDGFLEYDRKSEEGLVNQGWKDSGDAIFHADGRLVEAPVAPAEVQSYAYAAYVGAAGLAAALGDARKAAEFTSAGEWLRERFESAFWLEDMATYALALDGAKQPCRVRASNAGQVLLGRIASRERAAQVAATLMAPSSFSGWGIRTLAECQARFNPMSYHNGSVWPHDNALIGMGFAQYGLSGPAARLLAALAEAAQFMELRRLPEFFCGFARQTGIGPTPHPNACAPQAWASASIIGMLGALLRISFDPARRRILLANPALPAAINSLKLANLRLGKAAIDVLVERSGDAVVVRALHREGDIDVMVIE
jgi:glycogen debranching enzyme